VRLERTLTCAAVAVLLAGCRSQPPIGAPGALPHSRAIAQPDDREAFLLELL